MAFRPLLKISNNNQEAYLPNSNSFTAAQSAKIKKFLPKILSFSGMDLQRDSQQERQQLSKQKLKVKSIQGIELDNKKPIRFYSKDELVMKIWENIPVCVNIPFNNRQNAEDEKQQLQSKIQKYVSDNITFTNVNGQTLTKTQNIKDLSSLQISFNACEMENETFDNSYRQMRVIVSIGAIMLKKQSYSISDIVEGVKDDIVNSIKIMVRNKLSIRILRAVFQEERIMILQSFVGKLADIGAEEKKLDQLLNKDRASKKDKGGNEGQIQRQQQQNSNIDKPIDNLPRKQLSNRQLMLILLGLFFIYLFLKINPLEKMLSDGL